LKGRELFCSPEKKKKKKEEEEERQEKEKGITECTIWSIYIKLLRFFDFLIFKFFTFQFVWCYLEYLYGCFDIVTQESLHLYPRSPVVNFDFSPRKTDDFNSITIYMEKIRI
jgi:hypothetical protein